MIVLHGDNVVASRNKLSELLSAAKTQGKEIKKIDGNKVTVAELETSLQSNDLFGSSQVVVVEQLFSRPHSKKRTELIDFLSKNKETEVILWDKKTLTVAQKKALSPDRDFQFKTSKSLFNWIDALSPQTSISKRLSLYQDTLKQEDPYLCFYMLLQRVRQLLILSEGGSPGGAPFMISKMRSQARHFTESQLVSLHTALYNIDVTTKTEGPKYVSLEQALRQIQLKF